MINISLPEILGLAPKRLILIILPLIILNTLAWYFSRLVIDGQAAAISLTIIGAVNLVLAALIMRRFARFVVFSLVATYFFHALYLLLILMELRSV